MTDKITAAAICDSRLLLYEAYNYSIPLKIKSIEPPK